MENNQKECTLNGHERNLIAKYDVEIQNLLQQRVGVLQAVVCSRGLKGTWALVDGSRLVEQDLAPVTAS